MRKSAQILIAIGVFCLLSTFCSLLSRQSRQSEPNGSITEYQYKIGIAGFFPMGFPDHTQEQLDSFAHDVQTYAYSFGVHTPFDELGILDFALQNFPDQKIVLVTAPRKDEWYGLQNLNLMVDKLDQYLSSYPQIAYLALGNEVNTTYDAETFGEFLNVYKKIYTQLKEQHPSVKIFTTFQYEAFIGKGYLTGKVRDSFREQFKLIEPYIDVVGITTYPFLDFKDPGEIPDDYFSFVTDLSNKPIVVTETGWPTELFQPEVADYGGDEDEQNAYLLKLFGFLENRSLELVNWFTLSDVSEEILSGNNEVFTRLGLKNIDGTPKKAWINFIANRSRDESSNKFEFGT